MSRKRAESGLDLALFMREDGGKMREYQMQVGRAVVKLKFSEEKNERLKSEVLGILRSGYQNKMEEEFEAFRANLYCESVPLAS